MPLAVRYRSFVADNARWEGFALRPGDIIISTPAKCGTTWMQMICAVLVLDTTELPLPLDVLSPWMELQARAREEVIADLDAQRHRRFIKSHTPMDGLPQDPDVTYICVGRDPRDVALSWDNHMANLDLAAVIAARQKAVGLDDIAEFFPNGPPQPAATLNGRFHEWLTRDQAHETGTSSLAGTIHHLSTFWAVRHQPNVVMIRYEDLLKDLEGQMRDIAARLGVKPAPERWPSLVNAATFNQMRASADTLVGPYWKDTRRFFHRGATGQWREVLTAEDLDNYWARIEPLASPDLLTWLHPDEIGQRRS